MTRIGPAQPQNSLPGIAGSSRARSVDAGVAVSATGSAAARDPIIGHIVWVRDTIWWARSRRIVTACRPAGSPDVRSARNVVPGMNSRQRQARGTGTLTVAAVPIGRPGDASPLLAQALASAPVIAAEDTRRLRRLAAALGVEPAGKLISYYDAVTSAAASRALVEALLDGQDVLLVTDAGMPAISDPGYRLVAAAVAAGAAVTVLPGPSAVIAALAVSGLPADRFCFEGFLPRKAGERARRLAELAGEPRTMVFFESPHRLADDAGRPGDGVRCRPAGGGRAGS